MFSNFSKISRRELIKNIIIACNNPIEAKAQSSAQNHVTVTDRLLAYKFTYPTVTSKGEPINMTFSRRPEKYSSAAPMSADARQRIVCELVDLTASLTLSVSVCAPNENIRAHPVNDWKPSEVVEEVLKEKYMVRSGMEKAKLQENIESIEVIELDGQNYWYYEYTTQTSPNVIKPENKKNFRHSLSVSAVRLGKIDEKPYIYTLNVTSSDVLWMEVESFARETINSFMLVPPTTEFITPEKEPWLFF